MMAVLIGTGVTDDEAIATAGMAGAALFRNQRSDVLVPGHFSLLFFDFLLRWACSVLTLVERTYTSPYVLKLCRLHIAVPSLSEKWRRACDCSTPPRASNEALCYGNMGVSDVPNGVVS